MTEPKLTYHPRPAKFRFGVNHQERVLQLIMRGANDDRAECSLTAEEIDRLMAELSQCQHALAQSEFGRGELTPPYNPHRPFEEPSGYSFVRQERLARYKVGVDDVEETVGLVALGNSGRLTGYRMSPAKARTLAGALVEAADQIEVQSKRPFDA
jgi:hypothetical protein